MHLTEQLQRELSAIQSTIRLQVDNLVGIRMNYQDWAWAEVGERSIQVSKIIGERGKHAQFEEIGEVAFVSTILDLVTLAFLIDAWLAKGWDLGKMKDQFPNILPSERYLIFTTASNNDILEWQWSRLEAQTFAPDMTFETRLFHLFRQAFNGLYPFFSHDALYFSDRIGGWDSKGISPTIEVNKGVIVVRSIDSSTTYTFTLEEADAAIRKTRELLPFSKDDLINPFISNKA